MYLLQLSGDVFAYLRPTHCNTLQWWLFHDADNLIFFDRHRPRCSRPSESRRTYHHRNCLGITDSSAVIASSSSCFGATAPAALVQFRQHRTFHSGCLVRLQGPLGCPLHHSKHLMNLTRIRRKLPRASCLDRGRGPRILSSLSQVTKEVLLNICKCYAQTMLIFLLVLLFQLECLMSLEDTKMIVCW